MIIALFLLFLCIIAIMLYFSLPRVRYVTAAKTKKSLSRALVGKVRRSIHVGLSIDVEKDDLFFKVCGDSAKFYGINNEMILQVKRQKDNDVYEVNDVVVILPKNENTSFFQIPHRLRKINKIKEVAGQKIYMFERDDGSSHKERKQEDILGKLDKKYI